MRREQKDLESSTSKSDSHASRGAPWSDTSGSESVSGSSEGELAVATASISDMHATGELAESSSRQEGP